jgi:hypothetical protein
LSGSSIGGFLTGFETKQDNGDIKKWGKNFPDSFKKWTEIGGPVIGFYMIT